jgi:hypothetical protein
MDFSKLIARASAILTTPKSEWPVIAGEPATVADLYRNYILILAAVPAVAGFIKLSLLGIDVPLAGTIRVGVGAGIKSAIFGYLLTLVAVYLMGLLVNALAPTFGGEKDPVQALKAVTYAYTASWVASIAQLLPWIGMLVVLAGGIYGIYLLYLGLPHTMKCPKEKAGGYTAVTVVVAVLAGWIVGLVAGNLAGLGTVMQGTGDEDAQFEQDSVLGRLEQMGKRAERASQKLEEAQRSGDKEAQDAAMREMMGAVLGGGEPVESLPPEQLKPFLPDSLAGMARSDFSVERNSAMGMQISTAQASYTADDGDHSLQLEIQDLGSTKGILSIVAWANIEQDREWDHGFEKTYRADGRTVHEEWDDEYRQGEYSVLLAERFMVKLSGEAEGMDVLKSAVDGLDLAGLEAIKDQDK